MKLNYIAYYLCNDLFPLLPPYTKKYIAKFRLTSGDVIIFTIVDRGIFNSHKIRKCKF